ncbi:MAG: response regulator [Myxococcales bacterium]|nr:response regulator [Myxococcales bacterium]
MISRRLARAMGGELRVESALAEGSTFTFELPLRAVECASISAPEGGSALEVGGAPGELRPLQILVAEDNPMNQVVMIGMLKALGYTADVVQNGRAAVEALGRELYDVVLMDVQMPELDGLAATRELRDELPRARQPFVVALTAHSSDHDRRRCFEAGMDDYLSKPIRLDRLASTLARAPRIARDAADPSALRRSREAR